MRGGGRERHGEIVEGLIEAITISCVLIRISRVTCS